MTWIIGNATKQREAEESSGISLIIIRTSLIDRDLDRDKKTISSAKTNHANASIEDNQEWKYVHVHAIRIEGSNLEAGQKAQLHKRAT